MTDFVVNGLYLFVTATVVAVSMVSFLPSAFMGIVDFFFSPDEVDATEDGGRKKDSDVPKKMHYWKIYFVVPTGIALVTLVMISTYLMENVAGVPGATELTKSIRSVLIIVVCSIILAQTALDLGGPVLAADGTQYRVTKRTFNGGYQVAQTALGVALLVFPGTFLFSAADERDVIFPKNYSVPAMIAACSILVGVLFATVRAMHRNARTVDSVKQALDYAAMTEMGSPFFRIKQSQIAGKAKANAARAATSGNINGQEFDLSNEHTPAIAATMDLVGSHCKKNGLIPTTIVVGDRAFATDHELAARILRELPAGANAFAADVAKAKARSETGAMFGIKGAVGSTLGKGAGVLFVHVDPLLSPFNAEFTSELFGNLSGFVQTLAISPFEAMLVTLCWYPFWVAFYGRTEQGTVAWLAVTVPPLFLAAMSSWNYWFSYFRNYLLGYCFYVALMYEGWTSDTENLMAGNATFINFTAGDLVGDALSELDAVNSTMNALTVTSTTFSGLLLLLAFAGAGGAMKSRGS